MTNHHQDPQLSETSQQEGAAQMAAAQHWWRGGKTNSADAQWKWRTIQLTVGSDGGRNVWADKVRDQQGEVATCEAVNGHGKTREIGIWNGWKGVQLGKTMRWEQGTWIHSI